MHRLLSWILGPTKNNNGREKDYQLVSRSALPPMIWNRSHCCGEEDDVSGRVRDCVHKVNSLKKKIVCTRNPFV
jgi:hypothetical protein